MKDSVHLGYEVGTGVPVSIPIRHLCVTGQTQEAGKTTTLEALVSRAGMPAVAFVTKRFERSFSKAPRVAPYFKERADWPFVAAVLEATMRERMKFERGWIMRASKGAKTLGDVQRNVRSLMDKAKGLSADIYFQLDEYLQLVIPQIDRLPYADRLELSPGLNVMDLGPYTTELQALVIRSVLEWVYQKTENTLVIIPEAWEFIPQKRGSPVKLAAQELIRKGAAGRNYVWLDSQDIANVDKDILRSVIVWLLGVQRERNETKRTLDHIPMGNPKPTVKDIMTLEMGQFFVCHGKAMTNVYVQPVGMPATLAVAIARGERSVENWTLKPKEAEAVWKEKYDQAMKRIETLEMELAGLRRRPTAMASGTNEEEAPPVPNRPKLPQSDPTLNGGFEAMYRYICDRVRADPAMMKLAMEKPTLEVTVERPEIKADGETLRGRIARLIAHGFFKSNVSGGAVQKELASRGYNANPGNLYKELQQLALMGFLVIEEGKDDQSRARKEYRAVHGMQINIVEK